MIPSKYGTGLLFPLIRPPRNIAGALNEGNIPENIGLHLSSDVICLFYVSEMITDRKLVSH